MALVSIPVDTPVWDRFFTVAPLVLVGSKEPDGTYDLAPKHMAMPLGWQNFYAFVCSPRHGTYHNIRRERAFTVSFPRPSQVAESSFAAAPRCDDRSKPHLALLPTFPASTVDGRLVEGAYLHLECAEHTVLDGFGENSLIVGRILAAQADPAALRAHEREEGEQLAEDPLLAYVSPGRYAEIRHSARFPLPRGFAR